MRIVYFNWTLNLWLVRHKGAHINEFSGLFPTFEEALRYAVRKA